VTAEQKSLIERAATLQGRAVAEFVLTSILTAARRAIEEHDQLELSAGNSDAFVEALLNRQPINERLHDSTRGYLEMSGVPLVDTAQREPQDAGPKTGGKPSRRRQFWNEHG
jgi:uncharacterized protein (DUF1778 family)